MKKTILFSLILGVFFLSVNKSSAKDNDYKFGKVSIEELNTTICPIDSNAHAYYLFDQGSANYFYGGNGFQINYTRHFSIKILDKAGIENSTFNIAYYDFGTMRDVVGNIKACTYNLEGGKIVKSQLEKSEIFDEQSSKYYRQKKLALPNVKEGSVIEVSYTLKSDAISRLPSWQFQYFIPVLDSKYEVKIPDFFKFNQFQRGYIALNTKSSFVSASIPQSNGQAFRYSVNQYSYNPVNIPAFPVGEQLTTPNNYLSKVGFELASYTIPGEVYKDFTTSWADVTKQFIENEDFGERLKMTGFLKDSANAILLAKSNENERMQAAFNLIKKKMKWNGISSCWSTGPLRKSFDTGIGNAADINLMLIALLKEVDLKAYPVVLSTRSNGMIHPVHPSINQMNYVIALCRINDVSYLIDATDKYAEIDVLPTRCLNDKGWIIDETLVGWEPLLKGKKSKTTTLYNLELSSDGKFSGKIEFSNGDFAALEKRNRINDYESVEKYIEKLQENNEGLAIKEFKFTNLDTTGVDLKYQYDVDITDQVEDAGDLLFFNPLLYDGYEKNPFLLEKREYPVEYAYPSLETVYVFVTIPDGYIVESLPKSIKLTALENSFLFSFKTGIQEKKITVVSTLQINQTLFPSTNYIEIKNFFEEVVKKHLEKIVLKKV